MEIVTEEQVAKEQAAEARRAVPGDYVAARLALSGVWRWGVLVEKGALHSKVEIQPLASYGPLRSRELICATSSLSVLPMSQLCPSTQDFVREVRDRLLGLEPEGKQ